MEALVRHGALTAGLIAAGLLTVCAGNAPGGYLPVSELSREAASELAPPGAVSLATLRAEPLDTITGPQAGYYGHLFGSDLSSDEVAAFYGRELPRLGWKPTRQPIRGSTESMTRGWCKPNMLFRLGVLDPRGYDPQGLPGSDRFEMVFDARILGTKQPCPSG